jgi:hypothetical protein
MSVPTQEGAGAASLDLSDEALLPEEISPYDPALENRPLLYVQILDAQLQPRAGIAYEVRGQGLTEPRHGTTDENGELLIDDCATGVYELVVDGNVKTVPALLQHDLEEDADAYRVVA